jgi:uncharacterized protein (UPF0303 family)
MNIEDYIEILEQQEYLLRFPHFSRKDAWDLGNIFVSEILDKNYQLAISIRLNNGLVLFQYSPENTNLHNEHWMSRKFNLVRHTEMSSLHTALVWKTKGENIAIHGLDPAKFGVSGGGFPVNIQKTGVIGVVVVSGLPGVQDHGILVECISRYLGKENVPRIQPDADI